MKLIVESRFALLGLVMVALTALFGVAFVTGAVGAEPGAAGREPVVSEVASALRVCPPPQGGGRESELVAFATGGDGEGTLTATENSEGATDLGASDTPGRPLALDTGDADRHTVVRAEGAFAAGLDVAQTTIGADDDYATAVRCAEPGISTWYAAPGGDELDGLRLLLANVDDHAATVNVDLYATDGPAYSNDTRGISVGAHDEAEVDLGELIASTGAVAVHVRTGSGRIASSLFAERTDEGADWVPPTAAPAQRHVIAGVPAGSGERTLIVAAPGDDPATATLRVLTPGGEAEGESVAELSVPPAASATRAVQDALGEEAGTIVVEADRPVVVGAAMDRANGSDTAYAAAVDPLTGPLDRTGVVPGPPAGTGADLVLGAAGDAVDAVVTPYAANGRAGEPVGVEIEAGHTVVPELGAAGNAAALVVEAREGSGPVHAGYVLTQGSGGGRATAALPVPPAPAQILLPHVDDSLTSVVR
ncbi:DUF5719 family protein [Nocardiopsis sediminis]|uniref:DUF5719 family protein n=1 Tax=Nocardiopsis sediminis TaxID=1778267 RepID=A0ABV8FII7_9ACTN